MARSLGQTVWNLALVARRRVHLSDRLRRSRRLRPGGENVMVSDQCYAWYCLTVMVTLQNWIIEMEGRFKIISLFDEIPAPTRVFDGSSQRYADESSCATGSQTHELRVFLIVLFR